jgi:hypothetical protein
LDWQPLEASKMTCKQKNLHAHTMFLPPPRYFPACFRPSALFCTTDLAYFIPNPKGLNPYRALGDRVTSSFPHHPPPCLSPCDGSSAPSPCYPSSPGHRQPSTRSQGDAPTSSLPTVGPPANHRTSSIPEEGHHRRIHHPRRFPL